MLRHPRFFAFCEIGKNFLKKNEKGVDKESERVYNNGVTNLCKRQFVMSTRRSTQEAEEAPLLRV